jgi:hypothetical protein
MVVEVVISSGRPTETAATIADEAVRLFGERVHLAPQDILFVFREVEPNLPRFLDQAKRLSVRQMSMPTFSTTPAATSSRYPRIWRRASSRSHLRGLNSAGIA